MTVVAGGSATAANQFSVTLDANAADDDGKRQRKLSNGAIGASYGSVGTSPVNFSVAYTDPAGKRPFPLAYLKLASPRRA